MKFILSPARRIKPGAGTPGTVPQFMPETMRLLERLMSYAPWELESILKANPKLANNAFFDYLDFAADDGGTPALLAYDGLVFKNIDPAHLALPALDYADESMRILSAFYGMLRPRDLVRPYRLEMLTKLPCDMGSMYGFWGDKVYRAVYDTPECVVNLASEEYAKCVRRYLKPQDQFIAVVFLTTAKGRRRVPTTLAKMARGQMARYILVQQIRQPEDLKQFDWEGFAFRSDLSNEARYVFCSE